jgi:hypothetical protein
VALGVVVDQETLRERFSKSPADVFLDVLRDAGEPVTKRKAIDTLTAAGLEEPLVAKQWDSAQKNVIRYHPHVMRPTTMKYQWSDKPIAPDEALDRMLGVLATESPSKVKLRDSLADVIRAGLKTAGQPAVQHDEIAFRAAQERQLQIDGLRAVAGLAGEIEELAYNGGDPDVIVERVQTRVQQLSLEAVGRPGDEVKFDPLSHAAIGQTPNVGSPVTIVRPGYFWHAGTRAEIIEKALVARD